MSNKLKGYTGFWLIGIFSWVVHADTMDHYMRIASDIPKMEVKAVHRNWHSNWRWLPALKNEHC